MVAAELTQTRHTWHPTLGAGAVIALTAFGVGLALVHPGLAGSTRPHPTLTGSLGDAAGILQNNARVLAAPFLLVVLDFPQSSLGRRAGDLIVAALTAASTIPVSAVDSSKWRRSADDER